MWSPAVVLLLLNASLAFGRLNGYMRAFRSGYYPPQPAVPDMNYAHYNNYWYPRPVHYPMHYYPAVGHYDYNGYPYPGVPVPSGMYEQYPQPMENHVEPAPQPEMPEMQEKYETMEPKVEMKEPEKMPEMEMKKEEYAPMEKPVHKPDNMKHDETVHVPAKIDTYMKKMEKHVTQPAPTTEMPKMEKPKMEKPKMYKPKMEKPHMEKPKMEKPKMEKPKMEKENTIEKLQPEHYNNHYSGLVFKGLFSGKCEMDDALYYMDEHRYVICLNSQVVIQECAPGTASRDLGEFSSGSQYSAADFCSVNLVAQGVYTYEAPSTPSPQEVMHDMVQGYYQEHYAL